MAALIAGCSACALLFCFSAKSAEPTLHTIQKRETLSQFAAQAAGSLYGSHGSLERLIAANPKIKDPDLVFPGDIIIVPEGFLAASPVPSPLEEPKTSLPAPPPEPVAEPIPLVQEAPPAVPVRKEPSLTKHLLELRAGASFDSLSFTDNSTGSKATLYAQHDLSAALRWLVYWRNGWSVFPGVSVRAVSFPGVTGAGESILASQQTFLAYSFGVGKELGPWTHLRISGAYGKYVFLLGQNSQSASLDYQSLPAAHLELIQDLTRISRGMFSAAGGFTHVFGASPSTYTISGGWGGDIGIRYRRPFGWGSLGAEVGYQYESQATSYVKKTESKLQTAVSAVFRLSGGDDK